MTAKHISVNQIFYFYEQVHFNCQKKFIKKKGRGKMHLGFKNLSFLIVTFLKKHFLE